ncbi:MAG: aminoacyl-tRNA hydrolase [Candidatus Paceibacterota bacterium]|jgi:PTH1 family peptidyl-tRNA hydrolase
MSKKTNYLFVGLGNPGPDYEKSRHSLGRMVLLSLANKPLGEMEIKDWQFDKKLKAQITRGTLKKNKFRFLLPENMMNNSGGCVKPLIKSQKEANEVVVIHDDVDLPLGTLKISYNRGSGGHRGVESIVKALKTTKFVRLRLGVAPTTPSGKIKKPTGDKVIDFIIGNFKPAESETVKKTIKQAKTVIQSLIEDGLVKTMNLYN